MRTSGRAEMALLAFSSRARILVGVSEPAVTNKSIKSAWGCVVLITIEHYNVKRLTQ